MMLRFVLVAIAFGLVMSAAPKAMSTRDPSQSSNKKSALLGVAVTLKNGQQTCPRHAHELDQLRSFVEDSLNELLDAAGVAATIKAGTLNCSTTFGDYGSTSVVVQFVVKLHAVKSQGTALPMFVAVLSRAAYSQHPICNMVACGAYGVSSFEVKELLKKPKNTKLHTYHPNPDDNLDDKQQGGKPTPWAPQPRRKRGGRQLTAFMA